MDQKRARGGSVVSVGRGIPQSPAGRLLPEGGDMGAGQGAACLEMHCGCCVKWDNTLTQGRGASRMQRHLCVHLR